MTRYHFTSVPFAIEALPYSLFALKAGNHRSLHHTRENTSSPQSSHCWHLLLAGGRSISLILELFRSQERIVVRLLKLVTQRDNHQDREHRR